MARPRKVPAVLIEATVRRNAKLAALPSDTARLGYFYLLGDAKLSEPVPGQFASRAVFRDVAGRWAKYLDDYISARLLEVAPRLCQKCRAAWSAMPPRSGSLVVHDWQEHQYDPRKVERQREYEERQRASAESDVSDGVSDAQSDAVSDGVSDAANDAFPTGDSRGRARSGAPNVERELEPRTVPVVERGRESDDPGPTLSKSDLSAWSSFGPEWDAFRLAWIGRGFRLPPSGQPDDPAGQRAMLYQVLDARPTQLPRWVRMASGKTSHDVVAWILAQWHEVRAEAGIDDEEPGTAADPSTSEAAESLSQILARMS